MIEIFNAVTELVKSDFKTSGGVTALSEECRLRSITGCFSSHGGVAGTDNRDTVFRIGVAVSTWLQRTSKHKFEVNYRLFELSIGGVGWGRGCGTAKPPVSASTPLSWQHILLHH